MEHGCRSCRRSLEDRFRFCPWCGASQRTKLVEVFRGHPSLETPDRALRVSRYLDPAPELRHVRLSVWDDDRAAAAVALDDDEAARLGRFLAATDRPEEPVRRGRARPGRLRRPSPP